MNGMSWFLNLILYFQGILDDTYHCLMDFSLNSKYSVWYDVKCDIVDNSLGGEHPPQTVQDCFKR